MVGEGGGTRSRDIFGRVFLENIGVSLEQKRNFQNLNCLSLVESALRGVPL